MVAAYLQGVLVNVCEVAIEVLEKDGWTQGVLVNDRGERCLVGAMAEAARRSTAQKTARGDLVSLDVPAMAVYDHGMRAVTDVPDVVAFGGPSTYNDSPGRTVEEVCEVLRLAAKELNP